MRGWFFILALCCASPSLAVEPPTDLVLRIDAGMHTAPIRRLAFDAEARWLVTASDDKTARVWDLKTGKLLRVLRPPVGPNWEGRVLAVALSPDGGTVAVGGFTQFNNGSQDTPPEGHSIYLFDRASGRMVGRIGGVENVIYEMVFSPDGRFLAAGLVRGGIKLYRTDTWKVVGEDSDYATGSIGLDFSGDGQRLVTSSFDGFVRLYAVGRSDLRRLAKQALAEGRQPAIARMSRDGRSIAVGFGDSPAVAVLDGATLALRYALETSRGTLSKKLAWSNDGQQLLTTDYQNNRAVIRRWSRAGGGPTTDTIVASDVVISMRVTPQGEALFVTGEPAWGAVDAQGRLVRSVVGASVDFRDARGFAVSRDGRAVSFDFDISGGSPAYFDPEHGLRLGEAPQGPLVSARVQAPDLAITDWRNSLAPKVNGVTLPLEITEYVRSLCIASDGRSFILGTDYYLRVYDRSGRELRKIYTTGAPWGVVITEDGRSVVAALADGTIRWYDFESGRERLALFPHRDRKRWVAWTPSGYYQASPGGEDLIGWHQNRGRDAAADFYPASRFRSRYDRPDVVARAVTASSEADALRLADAEGGRAPVAHAISPDTLLPPVVEILGPRDGSSVTGDSVAVWYATRAPNDAPVTELRARVNGQAVALGGTRGIGVAPSSAAPEIIVPIREGDSEIQVFAVNKNGVSTPATVHLTTVTRAAGLTRDAIPKPKLYVLAVGVAKYANPAFNLGLPAKDARDFAAVLTKQKGRLYSDVKVRILTDAEATKDNVLDGLDWLQHEVTSRDVSMVFLAGHGMNDSNGRYYFLPHNADPEKLMRTGVPQSDIRDALSALTGKAVFFVDTCHSGNALGTAKTRGIEGNSDSFVSELAAAENGVVVFTASSGRQLSLEDAAWGNGAFTKAVVEGLDGKADLQHSGRITLKGLDYYIDERVKELTHGRQSPVSITPNGVPDFPLAVTGH